jgi:hypothetical protein
MARYPEDALLRRAESLRQQAGEYGGLAESRIRDLSNIDGRLATMRGNVSAQVYGGTKAPATHPNDALTKALARGKTMSQAALQGEAQMRMANLVARAKHAGQSLQSELNLEQGRVGQLQREMDFHDTKKRGKQLVRSAKVGLAGSVIGAGTAMYFNRGGTNPGYGPDSGMVDTGTSTVNPDLKFDLAEMMKKGRNP